VCSSWQHTYPYQPPAGEDPDGGRGHPLGRQRCKILTDTQVERLSAACNLVPRQGGQGPPNEGVGERHFVAILPEWLHPI
jgi:hypothetical protein